ncbi:MAG: ABC transporter permease [Anaerolineae bacterium]
MGTASTSRVQRSGVEPAGRRHELLRLARVFVTMVRLRYKARMMYPAAYFSFLLAKLVGYVSQYAVLLLIVARFQTIAGWTLPELLFLHSLNTISYTVAASFFFHVAANIERYVVNGELDGVMARPMHPLLWLTGFFYSPTYISQTLLGFGVLAYAAASLGLRWTVGTVAVLLAALTGACLLQGALFLLATGVTFWTVRATNVIGTILSFRFMVQYPVSIYGWAVQMLLTFVIPVAFINYYPAGLLLDRPEYAQVRPLVFVAPLVGAALFALSLYVWRRGLRLYNGAGS